MARACRILAVEGLVRDILGHVSLRVGDDRVLVRARGPEDNGLLLTRAGDVVLVDLEGFPAEDIGDHSLPQELPIHTAVLRRRADVAAVVHAHPTDVVVCSIAGLALEPIFGSFNIPAMRLAERGVPVYAYYGLIRERDRAEEMVAALGDERAVVLRGHGLTAVGGNLAGAVVAALNLNALAAMTVAVASAGGRAQPVPAADRADLPDLGSGFNEGAVWRHHVAKLAVHDLADVN
ncbi:MAG: class II aldolase/adducin family protein [Acidimicrobiales bacterium]